MPPRRTKARRRSPQRRHVGRLVLIVIIIALLAVVAIVIGRQYGGYLTGQRPPKHVAVTKTPAPEPSIPPLASSPPESPAPIPSQSPSGPRIAIIIDDCGYSLPRDLRFLKLPVPITLSILPLTPHGKEVAAAAEAAGKAVMLHIPMEPQSTGAHPGPGEISTEMTDEQIRTQLAADIASLPPLPGANNHMGSKASSDSRVMRDVVTLLKSNGMFFIDSMTAMTSVGASTAHDLGVPTAERDVFLDNQVNVPYIEGQIGQLEAVARKNGVAIAIGHPFPETAEALEKMVPELVAAGFTFVTAQSLTK
jgi:polysaccharide deacetylase 2 family uncharacterized protein YibQ